MSFTASASDVRIAGFCHALAFRRERGWPPERSPPHCRHADVRPGKDDTGTSSEELRVWSVKARTLTPFVTRAAEQGGVLLTRHPFRGVQLWRDGTLRGVGEDVPDDLRPGL